MLEKDTSRHPCFNVKAKGSCGRVHLPVAPKCNIQCNFCNRKYDCVNESRPGVTSAVLSPAQAVHYMDKVLEKEPRITVVGIAGPGDPFANANETLETIRRLNEKHPQLLYCLSTNGLGLPPYLDEVAELGVTHMTVTVNAVDPQVGQHVYGWVRDGKVLYRGLDAAMLLLDRQIQSIMGLKKRGVTVKVNTIVIPGVNDHHIEDIAKKMAELGVDMLNCMALKPNAGTPFGNLTEPGCEEMIDIRNTMENHLPQMRHCKRCRADAVGLLDEDKSQEMHACLSAMSKLELPKEEARPYVAVTTQEGMLVNQHLGEATSLEIWAERDGAFFKVEERVAPSRGAGPRRWYELAKTLKDCRALLTSALGDTPMTVLEEEGVTAVAMSGFIEQGLKAVYGGENLERYRTRAAKGCASGGCKGGGDGC